MRGPRDSFPKSKGVSGGYDPKKSIFFLSEGNYLEERRQNLKRRQSWWGQSRHAGIKIYF